MIPLAPTRRPHVPVDATESRMGYYRLPGQLTAARGLSLKPALGALDAARQSRTPGTPSAGPLGHITYDAVIEPENSAKSPQRSPSWAALGRHPGKIPGPLQGILILGQGRPRKGGCTPGAELFRHRAQEVAVHPHDIPVSVPIAPCPAREQGNNRGERDRLDHGWADS